MTLMQKDGIGLGLDAHPPQRLGQYLQRGDFHRTHIFAFRGSYAANDAIGMLPQLARQRAQGAEIAPLTAEVGVRECMLATQAAKQHGAATFETDGICHLASCAG